MNRRLATRRLLVGSTAVLLLAGCAAGGNRTPAPSTPAPASLPSGAVATPTPRPIATPAPLMYGPVTVVTGTATCTVDVNPTTDSQGVHHVRDGTVTCAVTTDDPRVSGTHTEASNFDLWGTADSFALVQWGTARLENGSGAWESSFSGIASLPGRGDIIMYWYKGTGGYAGLSYFQLLTGQEPWTIRGQIFPGDPPPPYTEGTTIARPGAGGPVADEAVAVVTGSATCPGQSVSWTHDPGGTWHARDGLFTCTMRTDDPRVSGTETAPWNMDAWGNPNLGEVALVQWGTPRLENAGGAWEGRGSGVASLPGRGDIIAIWYKGTGGYAGLSYLELLTGREPWTIQGQIFPGDPPMP